LRRAGLLPSSLRPCGARSPHWTCRRGARPPGALVFARGGACPRPPCPLGAVLRCAAGRSYKAGHARTACAPHTSTLTHLGPLSLRERVREGPTRRLCAAVIPAPDRGPGQAPAGIQRRPVRAGRDRGPQRGDRPGSSPSAEGRPHGARKTLGKVRLPRRRASRPPLGASHLPRLRGCRAIRPRSQLAFSKNKSYIV
jgi:hypothetical protein